MNGPASATCLALGADWCEAPGTVEVRSPFDGTSVGRAPFADAVLLERAIGVAHAAFAHTRRQAPHARAETLARIAGGLQQRREDFVATIVAEVGKPVGLAEAEVARAVATFSAAADAARRCGAGTGVPLDGEAAGAGHTGFLQRFPLGVVYGIAPFNFPLNLVAHKVAPALACGCPIVVKPSPRAPLTALKLAATIRDAGALEGQVTVIPCGNEVAALPLSDARVQVVSFTGSAAVGWPLRARTTARKVVLELGGNAAAIVQADADLAAAVPAIATSAFAYAGQTCISTQRVFVQAPIYAEFRERLLAHVQAHVRTGDPRRRDVLVGPMIDAAARERVLAWIRAAEGAGARVLCGGGAEGPCVLPTVLEAVPATEPVWGQEAFGPVVCLARYERFEEALAGVNASPYGLQAGVFTRDLGCAWAAYREIEAGAVLINQVPSFRTETMPYGGAKASGLGREGIGAAIEEMTEPRLLVWNTG